MKDEEFVSKTFNEGSIDLDKFLQAECVKLLGKWKAQKPPQDILGR